METDFEPVFVFCMRHVQVLTDDALEKLLSWVDKIPLTREKVNLTRDFSDGVTMAELLKYFLPKYVEMHHFPPANNSKSKEQNWFHLNRRVLCKIGVELHADVIHALAQCQPWVVENLLQIIREKIENHVYPMSTSRTNLTNRTVNDSPSQKKSQRIQDMIAKQQFRQIEEQNIKLEEQAATILKLEHVIHLKDIRIEDLTTRLEKAGVSYPLDPRDAKHKNRLPKIMKGHPSIATERQSKLIK